MDEARRLIYRDRSSLLEFDINNEGTLNELIYRNWLLYRKELREAKTDLEMGKMMLEVFNDAYYICTVSLMHPHSSRKSRWFIQKTRIPSLVMPLVHLYLQETGVATREIADLLRLIEGDFECFPEWKENHKKLIEAVSGFEQRLPVTTFIRRELTPELLSSILWWSITSTFKARTVKSCIGSVAMNLHEQKMMAKAIFNAMKDFEYENSNDYYVDEEGNLCRDSYDFSETYQLCEEMMDSDKYSHLLNRAASLEDIILEDRCEKVSRKGRPKIAQNVRGAFQIDDQISHLNDRLGVFYDSLKNKGFIANDTDQQTFIDMFKGTMPHNKIVWVRSIKEFHYLFKKINGMNIMGRTLKSMGPWQVVCSCFLIRRRIKP